MSSSRDYDDPAFSFVRKEFPNKLMIIILAVKEALEI